MNDQYLYPAIRTVRRNGEERFINSETDACLSDFWAWAYSDLNGNTERSKIAEYIVSLAMCCADGVSEGWGAFDILSPEGIRIEVKSSAYIQSWAQKKLSDIRFGVRETLAWNPETNELTEKAERHADVYVFCVQNCRYQEAANPLDLAQWDFYPVSTEALMTVIERQQKTVGLDPLLNTVAKRCSYNELRAVVLALAKKMQVSGASESDPDK